ncbi:MAG: hypothetical protein UY81_C0056G0002 [Candidatus Giovannonibacteria bacterium GW2011_GWA2_53_7]|uniref:Uncharacterized protein n=1 Tax=Candidatus Giovannonibacteria bacterium GW2011_GWA2_53_7 TaxID=1618650 RepID=A0A0G1XVJ7_9BACT|nr:MAG: hypothetical protein UY81_C0056G0002 [Candidatus Giovannonibacteria bacterium GW2011_GWA2_53_7]
MAAGFLLTFSPLTVHAQTEELSDCASAEIQDRLAGRTRLNVPLPGFTDPIDCVRTFPNPALNTIEHYTVLKDRDPSVNNDDLANYLYAFYVYFVWIVGILATVMVMYGGIQWLTAAGNSSHIENAKQTMNGAFIAVVLTLTSYLLLQLINPTLLRLRLPITEVTSQFAGGFCQTIDGVDYADLARFGGYSCGQVFPYYGDPGSDRPTSFCMSQYCENPTRACLNCTGQGKPYKSCTKVGLECAYRENQVAVKGTISNPNNLPLRKVELWQLGYHEGGFTVFNKVGAYESADPMPNNSTYTIQSAEPVILSKFWIGLTFRNGGLKQCDAINPDGTFSEFNMPFQTGIVSMATVDLDAQALYDDCKVHQPPPNN